MAATRFQMLVTEAFNFKEFLGSQDIEMIRASIEMLNLTNFSHCLCSQLAIWSLACISYTLVFITHHITVATTLLQIPSKCRQKLLERIFFSRIVLNKWIVACYGAGEWTERLSAWKELGSCR